MKLSTSLFPLMLTTLVGLGACSSRQERTQREHDSVELTALRAQLRPGLSFDKVQVLSPKMGNCTGTAQGAQRCEAQYLISVARSIPVGVMSQNLDAATGKYAKITFDFLKGSLVRWQEDEELLKSSW